MLFRSDVRVVVAEDWAEGMAASLRAGLAAVPPESDAVVVTLVDLPDVDAPVIARLRAHAGRQALARAVYGGRPGHPVLLGRDHLAAIARAAEGDRGAGPYLRAHAATPVECGDLATGRDEDTPAAGSRDLPSPPPS